MENPSRNIGADFKVLIVILNWNGWKDTIECLESIFRIDYNNYAVVVCDNKSEDDSLEYIKKWADGNLNVWTSPMNPLRIHSFPVVDKPILYREVSREAVESLEEQQINVPLTLIQTDSNLGFAGGNNVGIKYALARDNCKYVWLLNNDTVVDKISLTKQLERYLSSENPGICSSTLLYYDSPKVIQALGGAKYYLWLGYTQHIGQNEKFNTNFDWRSIEKKIDYPVGASMLVSREFLESVGLLCEEYFLYFEEIDWSIRAKSKGYNLLYAHDSIIYHREGASTGASNNALQKKSFSSDYYLMRNKIIITKKYFKYALLIVYSSIIFSIANRIKRRQWDRIIVLLKIMLTT